MDKSKLGSTAKLHKKTPSLNLNKNFSIKQYGGLQLSRQGSLERGIANLSKDSLGSKEQIQKKNNYIEKSDPNVVKDAQRVTSKPRCNQAKKIIVSSTDIKPRNSQSINPPANTHISEDKLKTTLLFKKLSAEVASMKDDRNIKVQGSLTRYTQDTETTISWSDSIRLDIETELTFNSCIGQGSFAKVYKGYDKQLQQTVAIKVIDKRKIQEHRRRQLIQTEVNILARMKYKHISDFYRIVEDHKRLFIVMQLCGDNTLNVFCRKFPGKSLNEKQAHALFLQISKSVKYMHDHNVAHRDLKLTNMLIDQDYNIKVIDFGFACEAEEYQKMYCGTPSYMAPEIVEKKLYDPRPTDIWSLGVVLFKLLTGEYAFGGNTLFNSS